MALAQRHRMTTRAVSKAGILLSSVRKSISSIIAAPMQSGLRRNVDARFMAYPNLICAAQLLITCSIGTAFTSITMEEGFCQNGSVVTSYRHGK